MPRVPELLDELTAPDGEAFAAELTPSIIETTSRPTSDLSDLRFDLVRLRGMLAHIADQRGLGVVGAGSIPMVDGSAHGITPSPRDEYQTLAFEQQTCGTQVHVDVPDRDAAVAVMQHSAPWLPVLLALSASSPFWKSEDTGYASCRTLAGTAGRRPARPPRSAAQRSTTPSSPTSPRARCPTRARSLSTCGPRPTRRPSNCASVTPTRASTVPS